MQQKADLSQMQELASRMKRIDSNLENQIMGMHKQTSRMIRETNSQYNESYVRSATQEVEETLNRIYSLAESISKNLRRRSDSLIWSANHYKQTEDELKRKLIQPFRFSWRTPTLEKTSSSNFVLPKADKATVVKVSGSVRFMDMLKSLWNKARDALLIQSVASYQEDERISSLIKELQTGTLDEQKVARQQLSEISQAFNEIARSQVAYGIYSDFGNLTYMKAAQKQANLNREALAELGVSDKWYNVDVNLTDQYKDSPLSACRYNPLKEDRSAMPDLAEMTLVLTAARINEPYREWVKANYEQVESTVKQAAQQRQAIQEIVDEYNRSMSPDEIKEIQTQLQTMNYYHGEVTGKYTADLLAALAEYHLHGDPEENSKRTDEPKNGFYKSLDSFKEIGQGILGSLQNRANKATDSPYDFFNWLTLGLTGDLPSGIYAGAKDRADHSFDSVEKFADWLTLGTVEMAKGAFNPEEAWSAEHWMNSLGMATLITGPLESQLLKPSTGVGIPKLPNPPSPKDISFPRGLENLNKNPVMVTPEGLRIKFDEVHTDAKPPTKTPVQEHFNKEMEQLRKGAVEGIEGTGETATPPKPPTKVKYGDQYTKDGRKKVLKPNVEYTNPNGHTYRTDDNGRLVSAEGKLNLGDGKRNNHAQKVAGREDRLPNDEGGHLIASIFEGSGSLDNLVPMNGNLNKGEWKKLENSWAKALEVGEEVQVKIKPIYSGDSLRPVSFEIKYSIDGIMQTPVKFKNKPGG